MLYFCTFKGLVDDSEKGKVIQAIHESGHSVLHTVITDNLTEEQAFKIEAELIAGFGIRSQGGLLTNRVKPNPENISKKIKVIRCLRCVW